MPESFNLELFLGSRVRALNGRVIGRLEEVVAEWEGDDCFVTEYFLGIYGWIERLAAWPISRELFRALRLAKNKGGFCARWDQLDLSDPFRPRLRCSVDELLPANGNGNQKHGN
jgi:hypothetical protein